MKLDLGLGRWILGVCVVSMFIGSGCSKKEAAESVKKAEESAQKAAESVAAGTGEAVKKGAEMASELSEAAMAYLSPLKEKFGSLDALKESPKELKKAVTELIQAIEDKTEDIELPEVVSKTLAAAKEKLVALKDYLEGEVEQAKIDEHIKGIMDSIKSGLGMSTE